MKKWLIPLFVFTLVFSTSLTAFAVTANYNGTYYLELPDGQRIMTERSLNWGTVPIKVMTTSNGVRIGHYSSSDKTYCIVKEDGTYDYKSHKSSMDIDGNTFWYTEYTYPFTIAGNTFNNLTAFQSQCKGDTVTRIYENTKSDDEVVYFFKNPLLEEVKVQQRETVVVGSILASYLHYLIPLGVSLLVLLISVPVFLRALRTFLR